MSTTRFKQDISWSRSFYPITNKVYKNHFGNNVIINRTDDGKRPEDQCGISTIGDYLDKNLNIDVILETKYGKMLFQEKVLRHDKIKFGAFTIEYFTNRETKQKGEFFNCCANYYLSGYANADGTGFEKYCIIDMNAFKNYIIKTNKIQLREASTSKASFAYFKYEDLPKNVYFYRSF